MLVMGTNLDPIQDQLGDYPARSTAELVVPRGLQATGRTNPGRLIIQALTDPDHARRSS